MTAAVALEVPTTMPPSMPPGTPPQPMDQQLLAALPSAVGCARRFVRHTLERWRVPGLIDTAEVVAAELVADAVSTTGIDIEHPSYLDLYGKRLNLLDLRLRLIGTRVLVELWDGGRVVRVDLEVPPAGSLDDTQELVLPRREGAPRRPLPPAPAQPVAVMIDPALLQRVLDDVRQMASDQPAGDRPDADPDTAGEDR